MSACIVDREFGCGVCASVRATGKCFCDQHAPSCPCVQCDVRYGTKRKREPVVLNVKRDKEFVFARPPDWKQRVQRFRELMDRIDPFDV